MRDDPFLSPFKLPQSAVEAASTGGRGAARPDAHDASQPRARGSRPVGGGGAGASGGGRKPAAMNESVIMLKASDILFPKLPKHKQDRGYFSSNTPSHFPPPIGPSSPFGFDVSRPNSSPQHARKLILASSAVAAQRTPALKVVSHEIQAQLRDYRAFIMGSPRGGKGGSIRSSPRGDPSFPGAIGPIPTSSFQDGGGPRGDPYGASSRGGGGPHFGGGGGRGGGGGGGSHFGGGNESHIGGNESHFGVSSPSQRGGPHFPLSSRGSPRGDPYSLKEFQEDDLLTQTDVSLGRFRQESRGEKRGKFFSFVDEQEGIFLEKALKEEGYGKYRKSEKRLMNAFEKARKEWEIERRTKNAKESELFFFQ